MELSRLVGLLVLDGFLPNDVEVEDEDRVEVKADAMASVLLEIEDLERVEDTVEPDVQPPVIDGTASTPVEIGTILVPQFAA